MFKYLFPKSHQKQLDNDLKVALLNYLSKTAHPRIKDVWKTENNKNPNFEKWFNYVKSL